MACYNLMLKQDRDKLRQERTAELRAVQDGTWPRSIDDSMRWLNAPTDGLARPEVNRRLRAEYAARMCQADLNYLKDLEKRIASGEYPC